MHVAFLIKSFCILQETEPKLSPSWNPKIICEPHPQFTEPVSSSVPFEPVQVGSLCGKIELSLTLKNNLAMPGAKVNYLFLNHKDLRGKQFSMLFIQYQTFGVIFTKFCQLFFSAGCCWTDRYTDYSAFPTASSPSFGLIWSLLWWRWEPLSFENFGTRWGLTGLFRNCECKCISNSSFKVHRNGLRIGKIAQYSRRMSIASIWNWTGA